MTAPAIPAEFPTLALLPKEETEALTFLKKYPEYDGRQIVVAILDTGVDPGAPGLQHSTTGKPKLIDIIDCCGSGDVKMSDPVSVKEQVTLWSGRKLTSWPEQWHTETVRVGGKRGYDLFPKPLIQRMQEKRREAWMKRHQRLVAQTQSQLDQVAADNASLKKEWNARLEALKQLQSDYNDPGPLYDVLLWQTDEIWRVAVLALSDPGHDDNNDNDLTELPSETLTAEQVLKLCPKPLTDYDKEPNIYGTFCQQSLLNYTVHVYDQGNIVSLVTNAGSHGTHVAAMVGAYFPETPALNGVAPGVQMISLKIGETRLGSMETGQGLARAAAAMARYKCHLANISYGEACAVPDSGRIGTLLQQLIDKHGVIVVSSAGNGGPALSTLGAPGGTTSQVLGIGAYVSPAMVQAEYALLDRVPEMPYTWSSRGPTFDGDVGVVVYAPGGAITSVPNWCLQPNQLMNGTSMSSPNACGGFALILSGLVALKQTISASRLRRAVMQTARPLQDTFQRGLLQIDRAFSLLQQHGTDSVDWDVNFQVQLPEFGNARGLYLRNEQVPSRFVTLVQVTPQFLQSTPNPTKVDFEIRCALVTTVPWLRVPDFLHLNHGGRGFNVEVDTESAPEGEVIFGEVLAFDTQRTSARGPIFRVPVTLVRAAKVQSSGNAESNYSVHFPHFTFSPGHIVRRFVRVPAFATSAQISVEAVDVSQPTRFIVHALQVAPQVRYSQTESDVSLLLGPGEKQTRTVSVRDQLVMEICMAQFWSSLGRNVISVSVCFKGVAVLGARDDGTIHLISNDACTRLEIQSLQRVNLSPSATLDQWVRVLRPSKSQILLLPDTVRDTDPFEERTFALENDYTFTVNEAGNVRLVIPALADHLYDAPYESPLWMLFDRNKRLIGSGDVYEKQLKVLPGEHVLRLQVRHSKRNILEKLQQLHLHVQIPLQKSLTLTVHTTRMNAITRQESVTTIKSNGLTLSPIFVAHPDDEALSKLTDTAQGDFLAGALQFEKENGKRFNLRYALTVAPKKAEEPSDEAKPPKPSALAQYRDAVRDAQLNKQQLTALRDADKNSFETVLSELDVSHGPALPWLQLKLQLLDVENADASSVIAAADAVIQAADVTSLAAHYGLLLDKTQADQVQQRQEMDKRRNALTDALIRKAKLLSRQTDSVEAFTTTYKQLLQWLQEPIAEHRRALANYVYYERRQGNLVQALKAVDKAISNAHKLDKDEEWTELKLLTLRQTLLEELKWTLWLDYSKKWQRIQYAASYEPF